MTDKQLAIPGLEPSAVCPRTSFQYPRKLAGLPAGRVVFLEKRIAELELELSILKIQMEED